jgi:hypothetical protein
MGPLLTVHGVHGLCTSLPERLLFLTQENMSDLAGSEAKMPGYKVQNANSQHDEYTGAATTEPGVLLAEHVSYGPNGIRGIASSPYVFGAAFLASLGGFSFGYDQGVISIINVMPQFHRVYPRTDSAFGKSFMTAMLQLGSFVGCLFFPYIADRFSRKRALAFVVVIFTIGAIMQTASQNYGTLVAGRAIGGVGVGTLAMVCVHHDSRRVTNAN